LTSVIELALKAGLPLIKVTTEDTLNVKEILQYFTKTKVTELNDDNELESTKTTYCMAWDVEGSVEELYGYLVEHERVVILINTELTSPLIFECGTLPTPPEMVRHHLSQIASETHVATLLPAFGGLNLKEVAEVARLTMSYYGAIIPKDVMSIRRLLMTRLQGIQQVDTDMEFYQPPDNLTKWVEANCNIFLNCEERRLVPRGLLFDGPPGTGKTQGAKHLANQLQIPLYILDLGTTMAKYVGESEGNLTKNLQQVDQEEPCVMLIDEVEKVFKTADDNGVTTRLLSKILWWLQEHRSRVLTVMTTNDVDAIPPELYREGRIDKVMTFSGLKHDDGCEFVKRLITSFYHIPAVKAQKKAIYNKVSALVKEESETSHAELTQMTYDVIKLYHTDQ
jgi:hypothetical protein